MFEKLTKEQLRRYHTEIFQLSLVKLYKPGSRRYIFVLFLSQTLKMWWGKLLL